MNIYIWKHKSKVTKPENIYPYSKIDITEPNIIYPIACHAFFTKREAKKHLDEIGWNKHVQKYYELITITIK